MRNGIAAWLVAAVVSACAPTAVETHPIPGVVLNPAQSLQPNADAFVQAQRRRIQTLELFASRGSGELRWTDEQGSHFEQAQVELAWRDGGQRMALRADKLGERIAWAGADPQQWWIFEPKAQPSRLTTGPRGVPARNSALPFAGPESIMELLAAREWPVRATLGEQLPDGSRWVEWTLSQPIGAWTISRARMVQPGDLPVAVELLDAQRQVLASSELSRPIPVEVQGLPPGAWPNMAGTTRLRRGLDDKAATWDIFLDAPGTNPERLRERLFDLAVLKQVMRPEVVRDLGSQSHE